MKKFSKLIDLPILTEEKGMRLGKISDVLFDTKTLQICALIVSTNSIIPLAKLIKINDISKIDASTVWVNNKNALVSKKAMRGNENIASFQKELEGTIVIQNSNRIGTVSDILFNTEAGEIAEFELSDGFVEDILSGRKSVAVEKNVKINDKIIEFENGE